MMKSHQLRHAVLGKMNFCIFLFLKKIKNGKHFFAEGKHGKIFFCIFFRKNKKWKNIFAEGKHAKNVFCIFLFLEKNMEKILFAEVRHGKIKFCTFFFAKITSNATKVVCIVLAGGHSETLGDYLLL